MPLYVQLILIKLTDVFTIDYCIGRGRDKMKIKLRLNKKTEEKIKKELLQKDIEITRISNAIIIRRNAIKKIKPALSSKFYLTLKNGAQVDVTRT